MKNTVKTIVYSFLAVGLFGFSAISAFAAAQFNTHANDYATVLVSNYTNNPNTNQAWYPLVSADAGDIVSVLVYYHNNGDQDAISTKLKITSGTFLSAANTHSISGSVGASNATTMTQSGTINISSSQSLTYIAGSASWYPYNQSSTEYAFPNGQNGTEIFSGSGFNVGTVAPGWPSQGSFVVQYKVSDNQVEDEDIIVTTNSYSLNSNNTQATLNGYVNGQGQNTYTWFIYGTNSSLSVSSSSSTFQEYQSSSSTNFSDVISGLNDNTTYYYKACATGNSGPTVCGNTLSFSTGDEYDPEPEENEDLEVATLSPQDVDENSAELRGDILETNGEDVVRYFEWGEDDDDLDETTFISGQTDNEGEFSKTISGLNDNTTYYYRACIESQDSNDDDCGSVKSFKTDKENNDWGNDSCDVNTSSATTFATGLTGSSAVLNGVSINGGNSSASSYFQYGTSTSLGTSVGTQTVFSCQTLYNSYNLTGLLPNKTYYYRINTGNTQGQIKSFKTGSNTTTVVINTNTNTTTTNTNTNTNTGGGIGIVYLALDITPDFENVYQGDVINFDVDYRNLYNGDLEDVVIKIMFPEEIEFSKSTQGFYSTLDRELIVDLGDLEDDEEGTFLVQAEVLGRFNNQDLVVTVAEGTYDHPTIEKAQGSSTAYALNTILLDRSTLGAFAFGAGFLPGIFGWLILILLLLLIVWISRRIYNDHNDRQNKKPNFQIN